MNKNCFVLPYFLFLFSCEPPKNETFSDCLIRTEWIDRWQTEDFRDHLERQGCIIDSIATSDTFYRFRGLGGWGGFDYICSVYADNAGYQAEAIRMVRRRPKALFWQAKRQLRPAEWDSLRGDFLRENFWNAATDTLKEWASDGDENFLWAKEGSQFRFIRLNLADRTRFARALGKRLCDLCRLPANDLVASYRVRGDSLDCHFWTEALEDYSFLINYDYRLDGKSLNRDNTGMTRLTVHKRDSALIYQVRRFEKLADGTSRVQSVVRLEKRE